MDRYALDALAKLSPGARRVVIAQTVARVADSLTMQRRRRGLPITCPYRSCAWEAQRARISPANKSALRDHLIVAHSTAMLLEAQR